MTPWAQSVCPASVQTEVRLLRSVPWSPQGKRALALMLSLVCASEQSALSNLAHIEDS